MIQIKFLKRENNEVFFYQQNQLFHCFVKIDQNVFINVTCEQTVYSLILTFLCEVCRCLENKSQIVIVVFI